MTTTHVNACIVGGGPAGLMLGLLLAKRGADVLVLESHETFDREYRGEELQPSTAHLLDELGLLHYILAQPHSLLEAGKVRLTVATLASFPSRGFPPSIRRDLMPQPVFLAVRCQGGTVSPFTCWMGAVSELCRRTAARLA